MASELNSEFAIVFGAPRSGTSFLMSVLDRVTPVESVSGNLLPVGVAHIAAQELPDELRESLERSLRCALSDYLQSGLYRSRSAALRKWWSASRRPSQLPGALRGRRVERLLAYKEPFLAFAPELALRALPQSRFVYIYRDGRDVANSLVRSYDVLTDRKLATLDSNEVQLGRRVGDLYVPWWVADDQTSQFVAATPYVRAVWMWQSMVSRCREALGRYAYPEQVLTVRYEDLVSDPVRSGTSVARHLGVRVGRPALRRLRSAHPRSIGAYRQRGAEEIRDAERIAGAQLIALGYELTTPDPIAAPQR